MTLLILHSTVKFFDTIVFSYPHWLGIPSKNSTAKFCEMYRKTMVLRLRPSIQKCDNFGHFHKFCRLQSLAFLSRDIKILLQLWLFCTHVNKFSTYNFPPSLLCIFASRLYPSKSWRFYGNLNYFAHNALLNLKSIVFNLWFYIYFTYICVTIISVKHMKVLRQAQLFCAW